MQAWVIFCHHRPHFADADMGFLRMAAAAPYGFVVTHERDVVMKARFLCVRCTSADAIQPVFADDPGPVDVRSTVHVYSMRFAAAAPL
jgi:predicted nicotinamide N-methyase